MDLLFDNIEIYPYKRRQAGENNKKRWPGGAEGAKTRIPRFRIKLEHVFNAGSLALACAGFFLGRAVILGELAPFGAAFVVASAWVYGRGGLMGALAVVLGLVTVSKGTPLASSVLTVLSAWLLAHMIPADMKRPWLVLPAIVLAVTMIIKTSFISFQASTLYAYYTILFEAVFAALLTMVMMYGLGALKKKAGDAHPFTGEEIFCLLLILGGLIAGTGDLKFDIVSLKGVLCRTAILFAAFLGGAGAGAAAGAVAGIMPGLFYVSTPVITGTYSFAGLLAGICKNFGKVGVATGFILGNIILSVYVNNFEDIITVLVETGIATLLFSMIPLFFFEDLKGTLGVAPEKNIEPREDGSYLKEIFEDRVRNWARVFNEMSGAFGQVSTTTGQSWEEQNLQKLLNRVGDKVCGDCAFCSACWEREFYKTYQGLIDVLALVETNGKVSPDSFPDDIKRRCTRTKELAITISCMYESYNLNRYWFRRLVESREIVSEQLRGISEVMAGLSGEIDFEVETGELGRGLRKKLKEAGARVEGLSVSRRGDGGIEVFLTHLPCGGEMECRNVIAPVLSRILDQPMYRASQVCTCNEGDTTCRLRFYPDLKYRLLLGAAGTGKNGSLVSGDSYAFFHLKDGRFALVLSDGMGEGPQAAVESSATISLLRRLLESGFDQDLAIKTVNSILAMRSPGESFATVDLAVVNLNNGQANFIKTGAVPSFIVRDGQVSRIETCSLPAGIIEDIEVTTLTRDMAPGDILVMITDGILDVYQRSGEREEWLEEILMDVTEMPPREMAELISKLAQTGAGGATRIPDDMTVIVARLEKQRKQTC